MTADDACADIDGPWARVTPTDARNLLRDFGKPWWIAGGWAVDAVTGTPRDHEDIDVGVFRRDVDQLRAAVSGHLQIWSAGPAGLRPLSDGLPMPDAADQIWLRENSGSPWLLDVLVTPDAEGQWVNRREPTMHAPLESVTWCDDDGIRYLRPEYVLCFKAKYRRPKDDADFRRVWPRLDDAARTVLIDHLAAHHPGHAWSTPPTGAWPAI